MPGEQQPEKQDEELEAEPKLERPDDAIEDLEVPEDDEGVVGGLINKNTDLSK